MDRQALDDGLLLVDLPDDGLTVRFYQILFDRYPAVEPMFRRDNKVQAAMLRTAIVSVLDHLDDGDWLTDNLHALGRRHGDMGVTAEMYDAVGECMIAAMVEIGGGSWTPAMTDAWQEALGVVSALMLDGHRAVATS
ncbi:globin domain-containing protein [Gordonia hankookensis]|uniref:Flavoprotein n=1 Tax=Gordonia hankookensis TaxID=589403 RepID=A0ABR7WD03_9ACTN|nr:globin domain-containing protein [Gordonia hankookensis]MBD1319662.1 flavoprotein [Gordonia hankookensis]